MKKPGHVALVPFPRVDLSPGKPRPVLLLAGSPVRTMIGWSVCSPGGYINT